MFLLSIKPKYVDKIIKGEKDIEFRTKIPKNCPKQGKFLVYSSSPVQKVIGEIHYKDIIKYCCYNHFSFLYEDVINIRSLYSKYKWGISDDEFGNYILDKNTLYGFVIDFIVLFKEPKSLADYGLNRPPQNFCYIQ